MSAQNSLQYLKEDFAAKRVTRQHKPTLKQRRWKRSFSSALAWIRFPKPLMYWCECVEFFGCSLHCFKGFLTSSKTIDSTWKTEYENPSRAKFQSKTLICLFHVICKFSFDVYARPWVFFSFLPLSLRFLCIETFLANVVSDHDLFKMATASVKRFHTTIMHVIFESPQRYFYKSLTT